MAAKTGEAAARAFFATPTFAVVGASNDPSKYGNKIFAWYLSESLPVTPINPTAATITALSADHPAVKSLSALPSPKTTAVSIITPPKITQKVLEEAKGLGVPAVWLQPGTFDGDVMAYAKENFGVAVGGEGGGGSEGWCVLVDGDAALAGRGKFTLGPPPGSKPAGRSSQRFSRRSACDRCRHFKLRCERVSSGAMSQPCKRCARAMAECVPVGKPRPILGPSVENQRLPLGSSNQYPMPCRILPATVEALPSPQPFSRCGNDSGRIFLDTEYQPQVSRGSGLASHSQGSLENNPAQPPEPNLIGSFDDVNECGRQHDATPDPFDFDFTFGGAGVRPDEGFVNFELPITHTPTEAPRNDINSIDAEPRSLKINRKNCLQNLADLHANLLRDLDEVKLSKPANECDCSRASVEKNSENGVAPDHPVGKVLRSSEKYLEILEYFSLPPSSQPSLHQSSCSSDSFSSHEDLDLALGCENDDDALHNFNHSTSFAAGLDPDLSSTASSPIHCDVPTTFSLLTCYISLVRIFRTIFSCIYVSLLPLPPPTWNALPPIFPGLQLAGFAMERQVGMQIRILLQVSEDMLGRIEGMLGVGLGAGGNGGLLGKVMGKEVLRMMLQEEEGERPEGGCGSVESLRGVMTSLKGLC
ncbi:hypothetical protein V502_11348 [Pseudogymnoascus sp. VKM F-4520 (FW-2644)]|nr:hypothetical protein V502_11348 [Pseudogymnoascus sp. VKM F-4520 (FW-2644)]